LHAVLKKVTASDHNDSIRILAQS